MDYEFASQNLTAGQLNALVKTLGGEQVARDILADRVKWTITEQVKKLLAHIGTISVGAVKNFIASGHFKVDTSRNALVKIAWMNDNFRNSFLSKVEKNVPAGEINVHTLLEASSDDPIREKLGKDHEETYLADLRVALKKQSNGESGTLLTNGRANIFYIRDTKGTLWAVSANCGARATAVGT